MWNYLDVITLLIYVLIVILRVVAIARGGDPYHNRLLEFAHYFYGVNTMLLVLRFSSVLELSSVVGPLQLALFRMLIDLLIILVQFFFVMIAFSLVITKCYMAEMSYMTSTNNQTEVVAKYNVYCEQGAIHCLYKTSRQVMWSVFGLTNLKQLESHTSLTSEIVAVLYLIFLILSVIMLVNILVALLNNTYTNVTANAEVEWKYSRAVAENQYRNLHCIVVPFNLLSVPLKLWYFKTNGNRNSRKEDADNRLKEYRIFYRDCLFPTITKRYTKNYGDHFLCRLKKRLT
ncbi:short transient receptor potential channel 4-like isoform X2 [Orbicella faveolata]|uniref:short transient receptor potential channel 4-like isoform X2 n=1 Tax=Orbicella faveolata TaxID=48498 RepID=UPI0009E5A025|nr:short transient receptor potential channel 4-like isoform X2 [Orbicella faveolata]